MAEKSLSFVLPTDQEALGALGSSIATSGLPAENQIALRLWLTDVIERAGVEIQDETE